MTRYPFHSYTSPRLSREEMLRRARSFYESMDSRRSVRDFSSRPVSRQLIEIAIQTASSAPSGAHRQPWTFVAVQDSSLKKKIRVAAEKEEKRSYEGRMPPEWLQALEPLGTSWRKPYLEVVPWLVVVFAHLHDFDSEGAKQKNYYVQESVGIACGLFICALHTMGLSTLTHTPSPMGFLSTILEQPAHHRPYILFPVGYAAPDARVPQLRRKSLPEVSEWRP